MITQRAAGEAGRGQRERVPGPGKRGRGRVWQSGQKL